jgi:hypothetical protein
MKSNGLDYQGRFPQAAEAATDFGFENDDVPRKKRLGGIGPVHRLILSRTPTFTWAVVTLLSVVCAAKWVIA